MAGAVVVGRGDMVATAVAAVGGGRSVLLVGGAGVGKSTVLSSVLADLPAAGFQVLSAAPAESDAGLPFVTLIDLLRTVPDVLYVRLRPGSRRAVDAALLKQEVPERDVERLAVRLGVLELLRLVAETQPTMMAIDDLQWVDAESAEVLAFTARRLEGTPVVAVERVADGDQTRYRDLLPADALELLVYPLPAEALAPALVQRSGGLIGPAVASRICALSAGNPLFALEIVDSLVRRGVRVSAGEPLPVPAQLDTLLRQRLGLLSESARDTVRLAAAATRPTVTLLSRAGRPSAPADLSESQGAGIASLSMDGRVHFEHPLLRAAVEGEAPPDVRMNLHARLAGVVADPIERARHLAFAVVVEDETVAEALTQAAELARRRGAASTAFELAGLAAQRTPSVDLVGWAQRKVAQGWYAYAAGMMDEAKQLARDVIAAEVPRAIRAKAWLVLLEAFGEELGEAEVAAALADAAGDKVTEPWVRMQSANVHFTSARYQEALADALWAADAAAAIGDAEAEARALEVALITQTQIGADREREITFARAARLLQQHPDLGDAADDLRIEQAFSAFLDDRLVAARDLITQVIDRAEEHGLIIASITPLLVAVRIERALGNCEAAMSFAERMRRIDEDCGRTHWGSVLRALTEANLAGGSYATAQEFALQAAAEVERVGDVAFRARCQHLVGMSYLATGDAAAALGPLQNGAAIRRDEGIIDLDWPLFADLIEASARVGDLIQARAALKDLRTPTVNEARRSAAAAVDRGEAIVLTMEGRSEEAAEMLAAVAAEQEVLGMPLEVARTLLAAAEVERRRRRRGAARSLLEQARQICLDCKAKPLLERVEAELARLEPGRPGQQLTPMEERITAMVIAGATNREIAEALVIGVTTVESSLSHIYRKLGFRSRVDLVRYRVSGP